MWQEKITNVTKKILRAGLTAIAGFAIFLCIHNFLRGGDENFVKSETREPRISYLTKYASKLFFLNESVGWIARGDKLFSTKDSGLTWDSTRLPEEFEKVFFVTADTGFAVQDKWNSKDRGCKIWKTNDSGQIWKVVLFLPSPCKELTFRDSNHGIVTSRWLSPSVTENGGTDWTKENETTVYNNRENVELRNPDIGFALFLNGIERMAYIDKHQLIGFGDGIWSFDERAGKWNMLSEPDGGTEFTILDWIDRQRIVIGGGLSDELIFLDGDQVIERSRVLVGNSAKDSSADTIVTSIDFISLSEGWVCWQTDPDRNSGTKTMGISKTIDGGKSWELLNPKGLGNNENIFVIKFWNRDYGIGLTSQGRLVNTFDGGMNWEVNSPFEDLVKPNIGS